MVAIASAIFITFAMSAGKIHTVLTWRPIHWMGRASYSLYLIHPLVLASVFYGLGRVVPLWICAVLVVPISLLFAGILHWAVENPSNRIGRSVILTKKRARARSAEDATSA